MTTEERIKELEAKIYDTYYDNGGEDARYDLWPAVIKAKKQGVEAMEEVLSDVENGYF